MKTKVLMVCLGNICRSPLAEGILSNLIAKNHLTHLVEVDSAGTSGLHSGVDADARAQEVAIKNGFRLDHKSRKLERQDFEEFTYILVMDEANFSNVLKLANTEAHRAKVKLITDFDKRPNKLKIVPDPYFGEQKDFIAVYDQLVICCEGWLAAYSNLS